MENIKYNILILTHQPFPNGLALTNRIISYAKGLIINDSFVKVLIFKPTQRINNCSQNANCTGIYSDIPFEYTGKSTQISTNFINRRIQNFFSLARGMYLIFKENKKREVDAFIICSNSLIFESLIFLISKILRIKLIKEESEYPEIYFWKKGIINKIYKHLYINIIYKRYDGLLLITKSLINYFLKKKIKAHKMLHVPMTVEFDRFDRSYHRTIKDKYIAYSGSINKKKDGVDILIKAFAKISEKIFGLKLCLIGNIVENFEDDFNSVLLSKMIKSEGLTDKVIITGYLSRLKLVEYIQNATLLVMSRPHSIQSEGGFPTKLGEYLATGNPVVVTNVGEISEYLTDGESAFICENNTVDVFAHKLEEALLNEKKSRAIGANGRQIALEHFNYIKQAKSVIEFITKLKESEK